VEHLTKPVELYKADIHAAKGFGCVACHGGDATQMGLEAMDRAKGYIGKPTPTQVIEVCGRCHSDARFMRQYNPSLRVDQVTEYYTSVHGRRLKELKDPKVATCASCHIPHSIRPPGDARSSFIRCALRILVAHVMPMPNIWRPTRFPPINSRTTRKVFIGR
jgi:cytochrome c553